MGLIHDTGYTWEQPTDPIDRLLKPTDRPRHKIMSRRVMMADLTKMIPLLPNIPNFKNTRNDHQTPNLKLNRRNLLEWNEVWFLKNLGVFVKPYFIFYKKKEI